MAISCTFLRQPTTVFNKFQVTGIKHVIDKKDTEFKLEEFSMSVTVYLFWGNS
jgi:hypothetical protein